jgi:cytochrome c biogenesis protein CcmG/thiol:disulfide interchange protein DsbE
MSTYSQKILIISVIAVIALAAAAYDLLKSSRRENAHLPTLEFSKLQNDKITTLPQKSGLQIINIFASWCAPCIEEIPLIREITEEWEVPVTGIVWKDDRESAAPFLEKHGNPYNITVIPNNNNDLSTWNITGVPETLAIYDGVLIYRHRGPLNKRVMRDMLAPIALDFHKFR